MAKPKGKADGDAETVSEYFENVAYVDCLHHGLSDLRWSLKSYSHPSYRFTRYKEPSDVIEDVLSSTNVESAIKEHSEKENITEEKVKNEAKLIVEEIAHSFDLKTVRFMGYMLTKVCKRLFRHIYVNQDGVENLSAAVKDAPLVLVPSHNSYFDFLLMSFISFAVNLPLPGIASGQDFLHIAIVNRLLRRSGAFFMRRSFANDQFYKTIFTQYVQELIKSGQTPVEFFLEGTRSRTGKALKPKLGLLSMITEVFFLGYVPDIQFCPVSISYECITEEHLYLFELLGLPKPKESLKGLVKSRKVLQSDYGTVHVHFGKVISFKDYCKGKINRLSYTCLPRFEAHHQKLAYGLLEKRTLMEFAQYCVHLQQSNLTIYPRAIVAVSANQNQLGVTIDSLCHLLPKVEGLLRCLHRRLYGFGGDSCEKMIVTAVSLSSPILEITKDKKVVVVPYQLSSSDLQITELGKILEKNDNLAIALSRVLLLLQRNKLMDALLFPAIIVIAGNLVHQNIIQFDNLRERYTFLCNVFSTEFAYDPHLDFNVEFEHYLDVLEANHCIINSDCQNGKQIKRNSYNADLLYFLEGLILPFIEAYWVVSQLLVSFKGELPCTLTKLATHLQLNTAYVIQQGYLKTYESIILLTLKNALLSLCEAGCLSKARNSNLEVIITNVNKQRLQEMVIKLGKFGHLPQIWLKLDGNEITTSSQL